MFAAAAKLKHCRSLCWCTSHDKGSLQVALTEPELKAQTDAMISRASLHMVSHNSRWGLTLTPFVAAEMSHRQMLASSEPLRRCPSVKGFQARP